MWGGYVWKVRCRKPENYVLWSFIITVVPSPSKFAWRRVHIWPGWSAVCNVNVSPGNPFSFCQKLNSFCKDCLTKTLRISHQKEIHGIAILLFLHLQWMESVHKRNSLCVHERNSEIESNFVTPEIEANMWDMIVFKGIYLQGLSHPASIRVPHSTWKPV
jgi:hypothetical protein